VFALMAYNSDASEIISLALAFRTGHILTIQSVLKAPLKRLYIRSKETALYLQFTTSRKLKRGARKIVQIFLSTMFNAQLISPKHRFVNTVVFAMEIGYNVGELTFRTACIFAGYAC
jgi:hypothetical protein